ncbi:hypothetical protein FRC08_011241, partial [Ceratobasidium sp. 394]
MAQPRTHHRLGKATHLLGEAFDVIFPYPESKESAIVLIARAERVLATIDPIVRQAQPQELQYEISRVNEVAEETKQVMQSIAAKPFAKRLIDQAHDSRDIEVVNLKLTDILRLFKVATESHIVQDLAISEGARKNDQYHIEQKMRQLQSDDQALCNEFKVTSPNTALNMVRELQLMLIGLGPQDSPRARHFLEHAMKVFRGHATSRTMSSDDSTPSLYSQTSFSSTMGSMRVPRSPQWIINESDIRIDENSPLGRGGFGTVFKGQWNGATVAVKRLVKDASAETLLREVETWQGLRHPHVVQFFGASPRDSPNAFIVSQYLANGNATMYLKRNPQADRVKLARETAVGMEYLHSMAIIHGDLKAANVLITDTGGAALADFGLSEAIPSPGVQTVPEEHAQVVTAPHQPAVQILSPPLSSPPRRGLTRSEKKSNAAPAPLNTELSVSQALMGAVNKGTDQDEIRRLVRQVIEMAEDEGQAKKLVEAGAVPTLIMQFKSLSPNGEGINHVILALGLLSHDLLSANSVVRTGTATMLMEISKAAREEPVRACSAWSLGRLVHSDDIATKFIRDGLPELLIAWMSTSKDKTTLRSCVWTLGALARTDALAGKLVEAGAIPALATHLQQTAIPDADSEDLGVALFGVARLARTIKFSKALAAAGSVGPMVRTLRQTLDPDLLNWSARAIGCHMRPNSADMAKILLGEGAADGLARLPRVIPSQETDALGSFAFAIARFSCAEWGSGTRKTLVQA